MAVVVDDVDRAGVYARSPQGRRVQPAATDRHSHTSGRRWCIGDLAVKQVAYDRSRDFPAQSSRVAEALDGFLVQSVLYRSHVGPLDRRCRHSSHEPRKVDRVLHEVFDLEQIDRGGDDEGKYVLFRDRRSGQRLELNWYGERSPFWTPYVSGQALDHFEVRVKSVPETLEDRKSTRLNSSHVSISYAVFC